MALNAAAAPVLFDRALLKRRQERARQLGPVTFLLDRVAEDFGDRLQAVTRNFADVADVATSGEWLRGPVAERFNSITHVNPAPGSETLALQGESLDLAVS